MQQIAVRCNRLCCCLWHTVNMLLRCVAIATADCNGLWAVIQRAVVCCNSQLCTETGCAAALHCCKIGCTVALRCHNRSVDVLRCATTGLNSVAARNALLHRIALWCNVLCCGNERYCNRRCAVATDCDVLQQCAIALSAVATRSDAIGAVATDSQQRWLRRRTNLLSAVATRDAP